MFAAQHLSYADAHAFSRIVTDYVSGAPALQPFYDLPPSLDSFQKAIERRKAFRVDRAALIHRLRSQYESVNASEVVRNNIEALLSETSFTVCTAHQPNLFTGPLYFIYKILHAIKLAAHLQENLSGYRFVPVYYMGSEDADFAELNHTYVDGKKIEWNKAQAGAVGRMVVDKTLVQLIDELEGQLSVEPHGAEIIGLLRRCYAQGRMIQEATFELVNELYGSYGLVVLIPDHADLKKKMLTVFSDDLFVHKPAELVTATSKALEKAYDAQAHPRPINLFYLQEGARERIEEKEGRYDVLNTGISFDDAGLREELSAHPERFSPNVILRGIYQESILPNLAFIGGGGELAYWLQLKDLFEHYGVPYPILVLRNSFLVVPAKWKGKIDRLRIGTTELFLPEAELMKNIVRRQSQHNLTLDGGLETTETLFDGFGTKAGNIDPTLVAHVAAIKTRTLKTLRELEKKMLRAEKRRFADEEAQVSKLKAALFPRNGLQERVENISGFYAKWGRGFIDALYHHSLPLEPSFTVLTASDPA